MTPTPTIPGIEALLARHLLDDALPAADLAELLAALRPVEVAAGDVVLRQGDPGDDLCLVLSGRLAVRVDRADGPPTLLDEVGPGGVVGEMALLTGQPRTATVVALEPSRLARLARVDFERLAARQPAALGGLLRRILPRLRGNQLAALLAELFGPLDAAALREIETKFEWLPLRSGSVLFREGDAGDHVYVVANGRLRVVTAEPDGRERVLEEVGRGGAVGEVALLTGEPRSATVYAVRDSWLLALSKASFDELLPRHPQAMMQIARAGVWRLRRAAQRPRSSAGRPAVFAVVAAGPGVALADFARRLADALGAYGAVQRLASADVDRMLSRPGIACSGEDTVVHESLAAWLDAQERDHGALVLEADPGWTAWTRRCVRHADRVLVVARAGDDPAPGETETALAGLGLRTRTELALLHPDTTEQPTGTLAWLTARDGRRPPSPAARPRRRPAASRAAAERPRDRPRPGRGRRARVRAHRHAARAGRSGNRSRPDRRHQHRLGDLGGARGRHPAGRDAPPRRDVRVAEEAARPDAAGGRADGRRQGHRAVPPGLRRTPARGSLDALLRRLQRPLAGGRRRPPARPGVEGGSCQHGDPGDLSAVAGGRRRGADGRRHHEQHAARRDARAVRRRHGRRRQSDADPRPGEAVPLRPQPVRLAGAVRTPGVVRRADPRAVDPRQRDARHRDQQRQPDAAAGVPRAGRSADRAAGRGVPDPRLRPLRADHRHRLPRGAGTDRGLAGGAGSGRAGAAGGAAVGAAVGAATGRQPGPAEE